MNRLAVDYSDVPIAVLEDYGLSVRSLNLLENRFGVIWLDELRQLSTEDVESIPFLGPVCLHELRAAWKKWSKTLVSGGKRHA